MLSVSIIFSKYLFLNTDVLKVKNFPLLIKFVIILHNNYLVTVNVNSLLKLIYLIKIIHKLIKVQAKRFS